MRTIKPLDRPHASERLRASLLKKFPTVYEPNGSLNVHHTLSKASLIQPTTSHPLSVRPNLVPSSHLHLRSQSDVPPFMFYNQHLVRVLRQPA
jgi:hypothetical protein